MAVVLGLFLLSVHAACDSDCEACYDEEYVLSVSQRRGLWWPMFVCLLACMHGLSGRNLGEAGEWAHSSEE